MSLQAISHSHLKRMIEGYPYHDFDLSSDSVFHMELAYSSFIVATFPSGDGRAIHLLNEKFIAVFTDMDEYYRIYAKNDNLTPVAYDFDYILSANVDLMINPASECVFLDIDMFADKPETPFFEYDSIYVGYNCRELELVARKIRNEELNEFIQNPSRIYDYDAFFRLLKKSILLTLVYPNTTEDIADLSDGMAPIKITEDGYLELFTNISQIKRGPDSYVQVVNLAQFFEMVIRFDFEGIILNPDTDKIRMDREMILVNFECFRQSYDPSKYMQAHNYAFRLGD